jgi:alpha-1,3/alpha-1,6-mannosyltransferase
MSRSLRIGVLHPDLGIGGAERLVIDAATQLQAAGHHVTLFTTHHDQSHCFEETRDGTLTVRIHGDFLPRQTGGRLLAWWAIVRMAYLSGVVALRYGPFDVIFCDLVAHALPVLRKLSTARLVFYCHFPDQLLTPTRQGWYRWYRRPIDRLEAFAMGKADRVLVNSQFTAEIFRRTFSHCPLVPEVVYPGVAALSGESAEDMPQKEEIVLLSINRYERRKNVALALEALALLRAQLAPARFAPLRLVIAGGYDGRLADNRETLRSLQARIRKLGLDDHVVFLQSVTTQERKDLFTRCRIVLYTPENEHFGYVPLEAMAAGRPVVAVKSGGPRETIRHRETGLLCGPTPGAFAAALYELIVNPALAQRMGQAGRVYVDRSFSLRAFGERLNGIIESLVSPSP